MHLWVGKMGTRRYQKKKKKIDFFSVKVSNAPIRWAKFSWLWCSQYFYARYFYRLLNEYGDLCTSSCGDERTSLRVRFAPQERVHKSTYEFNKLIIIYPSLFTFLTIELSFDNNGNKHKKSAFYVFVWKTSHWPTYNLILKTNIETAHVIGVAC